MRKVMGVAAAACLLAVSGSAAAEETVIQEADKVVYEKESKVSFNDVDLDGELQKPEGSLVHSHKTSKFDSLIKPRRDFAKELRESADE